LPLEGGEGQSGSIFKSEKKPRKKGGGEMQGDNPVSIRGGEKVREKGLTNRIWQEENPLRKLTKKHNEEK